MEKVKISYECEALIEELKEDISEFGEKEIVVAWIENIKCQDVIVNYDFLVNEIKPLERENTERFILIEAGILLERLTTQNEIL